MINYKIIIFLLLFFSALFPSRIFSSDNTDLQSIVILNFKSPDDGRHYGIIIPESISKSLNKTTKIQSERIYTAHEPVAKPTVENTVKMISDFSEKQLKNNPFIMTGRTRIVTAKNETQTLIVDIQIIDLRNMNHENFSVESDEVGAILQGTIDRITADASAKIKLLTISYLNSLKPSPYKPAYSILQGLSFGTDIGFIFFDKKWGKIYDHENHIMTRISYTKNSFSGLLQYSYTAADSENSRLNIHSISANIGYSINLYRNLWFNISAGGGISVTSLEIIDPLLPVFYPPISTHRSLDPLAETGLSLSYHLDSLILKTGASYRRIFFKGDDMGSVSIHLGAGYRF